MASADRQTNIAALRAFIKEQGWTIAGEKEIDYGYQITIASPSAKAQFNLYNSGKVLIQSKDALLKETLNTWWQQRDQPALWSQQTLAQTKPTLPPQPTKPSRAGIARIGSDESGKGDYFGPLVVAAIHVTPETEEQLQLLKVRDSKQLTDPAILVLAEKIKTLCRGHGNIVVYQPERYNQLYKEFSNLNLLLASGHAHAIAPLQDRFASELAIVDQFAADKSLVINALARLGCTLQVEQWPRAEDDTAVAAASIVARAEFVRQLKALSQSITIELPKGASDPRIVQVGREIVAKDGQHALARFAKLHFKTTEVILNS